ncbi:DUF3422 family protein [Curvivirga aplysinae]|uniref:DUF3422 family protein n=1 Tax=Curvivirga aplysinae TaxID=2529852 RepID=UPI0012BB967A|nr:DUF3422 domain-containing protein [Curvivirga aplysinae]MTI11331.1 DUF3422 domain-containing protein [Curvivirga aplysinae]
MGKEMEAVEKEIEISMAEVNVDDSSMPQTDLLAKLDHPYRYELTNELHARPFERIEAPAKATFYAMTSGEGGAKRDRAHVKELCARMGVNPPSDSSSHFSADFGAFRLRWERHSEFSTYTFLVEGEFVDPFSYMPVSKVPADWLQSLPGERIVAVHVAFMGADKEVPDEQTMRKWLARGCLVTSNVASDEAQVWTDFQIHGDGHSRILIKNRELNGWKAGRVLQRVLEVMTYSNMALMTLPLARKAAAQMVHMDAALASLTSRIAQNEDGEEQEPDSDYDGEILAQLTGLSAHLERLSSSTVYRLTASRAYYAIVEDRLKELNEGRIAGFQQVGEFLDRRLAPAMRTCVSVEDRLSELSRRTTRAANLLRTRVDFALEEQNQQLLSTMARRSKLQLRLQETVEGLSVAAITYYAVGLVGYLAKAAKSTGLPVSIEMIQGAAIPVIAVGVWLAGRKLRKTIIGSEEDDTAH